MKNTTLFLILSVTLFTSPFATADQEFSDRATWEASLTGADVVDSDYSQFTGFEVLQEIEGPIDQPWGSISFVDSGNDPFTELTFVVAAQETVGDMPLGLVFPTNICLSLDIDASQGILEGFGFDYQILTEGSVTLFDSTDNVVAEFPLVDTTTGPEDSFFGWINCDGTDIARIEICSTGPFNVFANDSYSFNPVAEDPTCQDLLADIIADLEALLPLASDQDRYWIEWAIYDLTNAQDPTFWETEDRLSDYGSGFFGNAFWATYDLECVYDSMLVEDSLVAIQDLLSCVVNNEIEFAIDTGGHSNLIAYANFFESFADAYADAGLYLHAVLLNFYAWLFAHAA